jgi:hypothetical protein
MCCGCIPHHSGARVRAGAGVSQQTDSIIDLKTADEMRRTIPAEISKWTQVAAEAGMPRTDR